MPVTPAILRRFAGGLMLWALAILPARAQLSPEAEVSLITIYPGDAVYSLWGHSALRIADPVLGIDIAYNYGTFDFGSPLSFLVRFAYGHLDYSLSLQHYPALVEHSWHEEQRPVVQQILRLDSTQHDTLYRFLTRNARLESRFYRYDFLHDNCATRIRDALEHVLERPLSGNEDTGMSFRELVRPYASGHPLLDLSMNLAMGLPADRSATQHDRMFLPVDLKDAVAQARIQSGEPLVASTDTVYGLPLPPAPRDVLPWTGMLVWLTLAWGIALAAMDFRAPRKRRLDIVLFPLVGMAGAVLAFLGFISEHTVTWPNLHLLWAWPTHAIVIWMRGKWTRIYWGLSAACSLSAVAGLPWWLQAVPAPAIPLVLLIALRSIMLTIVPRTGFEPVLPA